MKSTLAWLGGFAAGLVLAVACEMGPGAQGQQPALDPQPQPGDCRQWQFALLFGSDGNQPENPLTLDADWEPFGYHNDNGLHDVALRRCVSR